MPRTLHKSSTRSGSRADRPLIIKGSLLRVRRSAYAIPKGYRIFRRGHCSWWLRLKLRSLPCTIPTKSQGCIGRIHPTKTKGRPTICIWLKRHHWKASSFWNKIGPPLGPFQMLRSEHCPRLSRSTICNQWAIRYWISDRLVFALRRLI